MDNYEFKVSNKVDNEWVVGGGCEVVESSVGQSVAKFYKWFADWKKPDTEYRINATHNGGDVWQWSHVPEWDD